MDSILSDGGRQALQAIFNEGAQSASVALSRWLGQPVRLAVSDVALVPLEQATELLGPPESLVAACGMGLHGRLSGSILMVFEDRSGLALIDMLLQQPLGVATEWGEIEQSAAKETTNIIGCAYVGALAAHLPRDPSASAIEGDTVAEQIIPSPPQFLHEFAGSLIEFALVDQLAELDQLLLIRTCLGKETSDPAGAEATLVDLNWTLLFVPSHEALGILSAVLGRSETYSGMSQA